MGQQKGYPLGHRLCQCIQAFALSDDRMRGNLHLLPFETAGTDDVRLPDHGGEGGFDLVREALNKVFLAFKLLRKRK